MPPVLGVSNAIVIIRANDVLSRQLQGISGRIARAGAAISQVGLALTASLSFPIAAMAKAAVQATSEFEAMMARVQIISHESENAVKNVSQSLIELSTDINKSVDTPETLAEAMYSAVQRGYSLADSLYITEVASRAAQASMSDTATTIDSIGGVLLSYQMSVSQAMDVSDMLFRTVDRGKISFDQLSQQLGDVTPVAYSAGIALEEALGALSAITLREIPVSEAATQVKRLIYSLLAPTPQTQAALASIGVKWGKAAFGEKGLMGVLQEIQEKVGGNETLLRKIFPNIRAWSGFTNLMYDLGESFGSSTGYIEEFRGATERANAIMAETTQARLKNLRNNFIALGMKVGEVVVPVLIDVAEALVKVLKSILALDPKIQRFTVHLLGLAAALGPILIGLGSVISILTFMTRPLGLVMGLLFKMGWGFGAVAKYFVSFGATILKVIPIIASSLGTAFVMAIRVVTVLVASLVQLLGGPIIRVLAKLGVAAAGTGKTFLQVLVRGLGLAVKAFGIFGALIGGTIIKLVGILTATFVKLAGAIGSVAITLVKNLIPVLMSFLSVIGGALSILGVAAVVLGAALAVVGGGLLAYSKNAGNFRDALSEIAKTSGPLGVLATVLKEIFEALLEAGFLDTWYAFRDTVVKLPNPLYLIANAMVYIAKGAVLAKAAFQLAFLEIRAFFDAIKATDWSNLSTLGTDFITAITAALDAAKTVAEISLLQLEKKFIETWYNITYGLGEAFVDWGIGIMHLVAIIAKPFALIIAGVMTMVHIITFAFDSVVESIANAVANILFLFEQLYDGLSKLPAVGQLFAETRDQIRGTRISFDKLYDKSAYEQYLENQKKVQELISKSGEGAFQEYAKGVKDAYLASRDLHKELAVSPIETKLEGAARNAEDLKQQLNKAGDAIKSMGGELGANWAAQRELVVPVEKQILGQMDKELAALDQVQLKIRGIIDAKARQAKEEALLNFKLSRQEEVFEKSADVMQRAVGEVGETGKDTADDMETAFSDAADDAAQAWKDAFKTATDQIIDDLEGVNEYIDKLGGLPGESPFGGDPFAPGNNGPFEWVYQLLDIAQNLGTPHEGPDTRKHYQMYYDGIGFNEAVADAVATLKAVRMQDWTNPMVSRFMTPEAWDQFADIEGSKLLGQALNQGLAESLADLPPIKNAILQLAGLVDKSGQVITPDMTAVASTARASLDSALNASGSQGALWEKITERPAEDAIDFLPTLLSINSSLKTAIDEDEQLFKDRGGQLWDKVEAGVVDRAKNSAALRTAIDEMVAASLGE